MSRHEKDVATWAEMARLGLMSRHELDVATWVAVARLGLMSRHGQRCGQRSGVATPPGGRDLDCPEWCRDTNLMSRHEASFQKVATWNDDAT